MLSVASRMISRFQSFGWLFGIKIIKQNIVYVKHNYSLSCFTQKSPVSKTRSSLVNTTVWLWLPRLNTICSWASHVCFSCHSDQVWTGTSGSVVRSCKYTGSKTFLEFFCFNWVVFQSLFSTTYSITHLWNDTATSEQRVVCHQGRWPSVHLWGGAKVIFLKSPHFEHVFRAELCETKQCVTGIHQTDHRNAVSLGSCIHKECVCTLGFWVFCGNPWFKQEESVLDMWTCWIFLFPSVQCRWVVLVVPP